MPGHLDPGLWGFLVAGTMLTSGLVLGSAAGVLLKLAGLKDREEER